MTAHNSGQESYSNRYDRDFIARFSDYLIRTDTREIVRRVRAQVSAERGFFRALLQRTVISPAVAYPDQEQAATSEVERVAMVRHNRFRAPTFVTQPLERVGESEPATILARVTPTKIKYPGIAAAMLLSDEHIELGLNVAVATEQIRSKVDPDFVREASDFPESGL